MTHSGPLAALRDEAMRVSCIAWAIQKRWALSAHGIDRSGPCPVCGGTDRFSIHTRTDLWNCRRCERGDHGVISLVMWSEGVEFVRACEIITGRTADSPVDERRAAAIAAQNAAEARRRSETETKRREEARAAGHRIWRGGRPFVRAPGNPVVDYLRLRGIDLLALPEAVQIGIRLRESDALSYLTPSEDGRGYRVLCAGPAMLAAVQRPDGSFGAVHQTWLDPSVVGGRSHEGSQLAGSPNGRLVLPPDAEGKERPGKKVLGSKKGGAIRLFTPRSGPAGAAAPSEPTALGTPSRLPTSARRLVMGEGIETTLTALAHAFEPETAYWAGVDLGNMAGRAARDADGHILHEIPDLDDVECFLPPDWVEELVYLSDSDDPRSHTEEKVIRGLRRALAWRQHGGNVPPLTCSYMPPLGDGRDLNDLVRVR